MNTRLETEEGRLEKLLMERIGQHPGFDQASITVRVRGRAAYLTGCVGGLRQKRLAGEMAAQVEGNLAVVNMLRIAPSVQVDDATIREHLLEAFASNWRVDEASLLVEVSNGIVHLRGVAKSMAEQCACEEEAGATPGVERVVSHIQLVTESPKSESDVARDLIEGLVECLGIRSGAVHVRFQDGALRLSGTVSSQHTKAAAEEMACWTPSVREVVNDLEVIPLNHTSEASGSAEQQASMGAGSQT
ncbi:MAG: BON domain-containing protein [Dehalococcoidia bacterium]